MSSPYKASFFISSRTSNYLLVMTGSPGKRHQVESHMVTIFSDESVTIFLCCLQRYITPHVISTKRSISDRKLFMTISCNSWTIFSATPLVMFTTSTLNHVATISACNMALNREQTIHNFTGERKILTYH